MTEREAFEAWAKEQWGMSAWRHISACCGEWHAWQARAAKASELQQQLVSVRHHLTQLATFADQAVGVLATIVTESTEEEEKLQAIIDGLQQWAPDALREAITEPTIHSPYCTCGSEESADEEELFANRCKSCGGQLV